MTVASFHLIIVIMSILFYTITIQVLYEIVGKVVMDNNVLRSRGNSLN